MERASFFKQSSDLHMPTHTYKHSKFLLLLLFLNQSLGPSSGTRHRFQKLEHHLLTFQAFPQESDFPLQEAHFKNGNVKRLSNNLSMVFVLQNLGRWQDVISLLLFFFFLSIKLRRQPKN